MWVWYLSKVTLFYQTHTSYLCLMVEEDDAEAGVDLSDFKQTQVKAFAIAL